MRKIILAAAAALSLAGCAAVQTAETLYSKATGTSVSQKQVAGAVQAFNLAETGATAYLRLPTCGGGQSTLTSACKQPGAVPTVIADVKAGRTARDGLWKASKASADGSVNVASGLYDAVVNITSTLNIETGASK